jgi:hypothetical protein
MSTAGSQVWWGDLIRAIDRRTGTGGPPSTAAVARLLGLTEPVAEPDRAPESPRRPVAAPADLDTRTARSGADVTVPTGEVLVPPRRESSGTTTGTGLDQPQQVADRAPQWTVKYGHRPWLGVTPLGEASLDDLKADPPHHPLFRRSFAAGIVQGLASTRVPGHEIDTAALVDTMAEGRPVRVIPRLLGATLMHGVQLLLDHGPAMAPYRRDQTELIESVRRVVGIEATDVHRFAGTPLLGQFDYRLPAPGRPVIVVSDFGISGVDATAGQHENWSWLVSRWRSQGCRPVALLPFPAHRWPHWLVGLLPAVCWDRPTTVRSVRVALGRFR